MERGAGVCAQVARHDLNMFGKGCIKLAAAGVVYDDLKMPNAMAR